MKVDPHQIVIPHRRDIRPVSAVKYLVLQASLASVRASGHYERYAQLVAPHVLTELMTGVAPSWAAIELANAHYEACDKLALSHEQLAAVGQGVGAQLHETSLVTSAKSGRQKDFDAWTEAQALYRMWGRLYQGGSIMVAKLGATESLLEMRGFTLNRFRYYRHAQLASMSATFSSIGAKVQSIKIVSCSVSGDEAQVRMSWS